MRTHLFRGALALAVLLVPVRRLHWRRASSEAR